MIFPTLLQVYLTLFDIWALHNTKRMCHFKHWSVLCYVWKWGSSSNCSLVTSSCNVWNPNPYEKLFSQMFIKSALSYYINCNKLQQVSKSLLLCRACSKQFKFGVRLQKSQRRKAFVCEYWRDCLILYSFVITYIWNFYFLTEKF